MQFFRNDLEGTFIERPNRFIVKADTREGVIKAHCPNPGRMLELLTPGRKLIFQREEAPGRKTAFSLAAARYRGKVIPLNSAAANRASRELILPELFPENTGIYPEIRKGGSRFDFLVKTPETNIYLEVKSCTLVEYGRAMFPDAPTTRGARHVSELDEINRKEKGSAGKVLFVITHPDAEIFTPNIHTDPAFSEILKNASEKTDILCSSISCDASGNALLVNKAVPIDLSPVKFAEKDSGVYMVVVSLEKDRHIRTGQLKDDFFPAGYYVYAGSALKGLTSRMNRHRNRKKNRFHWHIDYLTAQGDEIKVYPVRTDRFTECGIAADLEKLGGNPVPGFGSSDCGCGSHLFRFSNNPLQDTGFIDLLMFYRHNF